MDTLKVELQLDSKSYQKLKDVLKDNFKVTELYRPTDLSLNIFSIEEK